MRGARDYDIIGGCFQSNRIPDDSSGEDVSKTTTFASFVPELTTDEPHSADTNSDGQIGLSEVLRVVQLHNADAYQCDTAKSEDGFLPGAGSESCDPHDSDFLQADFVISLSELLRVIALYNGPFYESCSTSEDGFCIVSR